MILEDFRLAIADFRLKGKGNILCVSSFSHFLCAKTTQEDKREERALKKNST
jgi:hypothetical protein